MSKQYVPTEPGGCILDYTYCASPKCENECGRKMTKSIEKRIKAMGATRIAYSYFCGGESE